MLSRRNLGAKTVTVEVKRMILPNYRRRSRTLNLQQRS
jgi:hypothetical protein